MFEFVFCAFSLLEFFSFPLIDFFNCAFVSLVLITLSFSSGCFGVQVCGHFHLNKGLVMLRIVAG